MKINYIYKVLFVVLSWVVFQACEKDPVFPDPGFELEDQRVEVRRDTADFYDVNLKMNVPNGVESIDILNATDYTVLESLKDYNGEKKFDFNYRIDLRPFENDTVLNYIIKVVDQDSRSFNRGLRLGVKGFSFPEIKLIGGANIAVAAPAYNVKGLISTGLNTISSVKVLFEGEEQYSYEDTSNDMLQEMPLNTRVFLGDLQEGVDYFIDIVIVDDKGQESTSTISVRKSEFIKIPRKINYSNYRGTLVYITPTYDEEGMLIAFDYEFSSNGTNYRSEFNYNENDMVDTIDYKSVASDGSYSRGIKIYINYVEGTKEIFSIEEQDFDYDEMGNVVAEGEVEVVSDEFVYNENGEVVSFFTSSKVENIYYSDPFDLGESLFGEYWQSDNYMSSNAERRQHRTSYDPVLMPTYTESIPPFLTYSSTLMEVFNDLLWNKYIMTKTVPTSPSYNSDYLREPAYTYETDDEGNIISIIKTYTSGGFRYEGTTETYTFFY